MVNYLIIFLYNTNINILLYKKIEIKDVYKL